MIATLGMSYVLWALVSTHPLSLVSAINLKR